MIPYEIREAILALKGQGRALREISRALKISRNTVRRTLRQPGPKPPREHSEYRAIIEKLPELYRRCKGNGVRIGEILKDEYDIEVAYSTLTSLLRKQELRAPKRRSGIYHFEPGQETQHDTSPHRLELGDKPGDRPVRKLGTGLQPDAIHPVLSGLHPFRGEDLFNRGIPFLRWNLSPLHH